MELVYAAMLLHKAGKPVSVDNVKKVIEAAGVKKDEAQIKALVAALEGVDIDKAIKEASVPVAVAAPVSADKPAEKKEEKVEKAKEEEEAKATAGLGALFG